MPNKPISPIQRLVGIDQYRGIHIADTDEVARFNRSQWLREPSADLLGGRITQWGQFRFGRPKSILSFSGPQMRYWPIIVKPQSSTYSRLGATFQPQIFQNGALFKTAPQPVLGAQIVTHRVTGVFHLLAVTIQSDALDEVFSLDLTDPDNTDWVSCGTLPTRDDDPGPANDNFAVPRQFLIERRAWFFNDAGTRAVTQREFASRNERNERATEDPDYKDRGNNRFVNYLLNFDLEITHRPETSLTPFSVNQIDLPVELGEESGNNYSFLKTIARDFDADREMTLQWGIDTSVLNGFQILFNGADIFRTKQLSFNPEPYPGDRVPPLMADLRAGGFVVYGYTDISDAQFEPDVTERWSYCQVFENGTIREIESEREQV